MIDFVAFDLETTGLESTSGICQLAFVRFRSGEPVDYLVTHINPGPRTTWNSVASSITGITRETVSQAPSFDSTLRAAEAFIGTDPLVAHNARFDVDRWVREGGFAINAICTLVLAQSHFGPGKNRLDDLASEIGIVRPALHDAQADATHCGYLFIHLQSVMGLSSLTDLEKRYPGALITPKARVTGPREIRRVDPTKSIGRAEFEALKESEAYGINSNGDLSGKFVIFSKLKQLTADEAQSLMVKFGGMSLNNVSHETDYLVVGDLNLATDNPTTKVKKALHVRNNGGKVQIIGEDDFIRLAGGIAQIRKMLAS